MKKISKLFSKTVIVFAVFIALGCAAKSSSFHTSTPTSESTETPVFSASFEPIKNNSNFFSTFILTIHNKTDHDIEIDWNKTYYFHNKNNLGNFVFKDIVPSDIRNGSVPNDVIEPGIPFSKIISPLSKVARASRKNINAAYENKGLYSGLLPEGENSILLAIINNGETINRSISVFIKEEK